jgi:hypothetical protein
MYVSFCVFVTCVSSHQNVICLWFLITLSRARSPYLLMIRCLKNNELEYWRKRSRYYHYICMAELRKISKDLSQYSRSPYGDTKPEPEYEGKILKTRCSDVENSLCRGAVGDPPECIWNIDALVHCWSFEISSTTVHFTKSRKCSFRNIVLTHAKVNFPVSSTSPKIRLFTLGTDKPTQGRRKRVKRRFQFEN